MKQRGQVVLFQFPQTDGARGKLRPALLLARLPGPYDDWLTCMISTQIAHAAPGFDEVISPGDSDFAASGLRSASVVRIGRLAVVDASILLGAIGTIGPERLARIREHLRGWLA